MKTSIIRVPLLTSVSLLFISSSVFAQDIQINEKTMRDAWAEDEPQFDSLSNDPDLSERDPYFNDDYSDNERNHPADEDNLNERYRQGDRELDSYERR